MFLLRGRVDRLAPGGGARARLDLAAGAGAEEALPLLIAGEHDRALLDVLSLAELGRSRAHIDGVLVRDSLRRLSPDSDAVDSGIVCP